MAFRLRILFALVLTLPFFAHATSYDVSDNDFSCGYSSPMGILTQDNVDSRGVPLVLWFGDGGLIYSDAFESGAWQTDTVVNDVTAAGPGGVVASPLNLTDYVAWWPGSGGSIKMAATSNTGGSWGNDYTIVGGVDHGWVAGNNDGDLVCVYVDNGVLYAQYSDFSDPTMWSSAYSVYTSQHTPEYLVVTGGEDDYEILLREQTAVGYRLVSVNVMPPTTTAGTGGTHIIQVPLNVKQVATGDNAFTGQDIAYANGRWWALACEALPNYPDQAVLWSREDSANKSWNVVATMGNIGDPHQPAIIVRDDGAGGVQLCLGFHCNPDENWRSLKVMRAEWYQGAWDVVDTDVIVQSPANLGYPALAWSPDPASYFVLYSGTTFPDLCGVFAQEKLF